MEQGRAARDVVPAEVWGEARVEAEWADHLQQGRVEVAYARNVATRFLML